MIKVGRPFALILLMLLAALKAVSQGIDFSHATIFATENGKRTLAEPILVLTEEIYRRTGINLAATSDITANASSTSTRIIVATRQDLPVLPTSVQSALDRMAPIGKDGFNCLFNPTREQLC